MQRIFRFLAITIARLAFYNENTPILFIICTYVYIGNDYVLGVMLLLLYISMTSFIMQPLKEGSVPQDEWENTCQLALGHKISIWTQFIEPALYQRAEVLIIACLCRL